MLLEPTDRYSQRNNTYKPFSACMPTSFVMWCIAENLDIEERLKENAPVDNWCMVELNTDDAIAFAIMKYGDLIKQKYSPNEIHGMYHSWIEPLIFGEIKSDFIYAAENSDKGFTFDEYIDIIRSGHAIWTSGKYQGMHGPIEGHASLFAGEDNGQLRIVDPYGNFHFNFRDDQGYDVRMNEQEFIDYIKPIGQKRKNAHILRGIK